MSDKTNYQEMRFDPHPTQQMVDACCARIAELEAENLRLTLAQPVYSRRQLQARLEQAEADRDKWEWVARDACRELAYETHVNPESPLDYRLAHLPRPPSPPD